MTAFRYFYFINQEWEILIIFVAKSTDILSVSRKKKEFPVFEKVTIAEVAAEGKALTKVNDFVVFVPYAVPGDIVDL